MCVLQLSSSVVADMSMVGTAAVFGRLDLVIFLVNGLACNQSCLSSMQVSSKHSFQFANSD